MSEDEEPDWLAELARNTEALRRQIDQGGETLRREVELLGRAAEQFIRGPGRPTSGIGPVPLFQQRLVRAAGAMMRELLPPRKPSWASGGASPWCSCSSPCPASWVSRVPTGRPSTTT
jgi:hypothetical protein